MKKMIVLVACVVLSWSSAWSQGKPPHPFAVFRKGVIDHNLLGAMQQLKKDSAAYVNDRATRKVYFEFLVQLYNLVGDYRAALQAEEAMYEATAEKGMYRPERTDQADSSLLAGCTPRDAVDVIATAAKTRQIIIVNEEHRTTAHRALTFNLLKQLYQEGFRYFAPETITAVDSLLQTRGYATHNTGFYSSDPVFADVIREAIKIGYTVVPYEFEGRCAFADADSCQDERERMQAQHIQDRILKKDPRAKILMHVGRSHAAKTDYAGHYRLMAWHLRSITGIDPFTVEQVFYSPYENQKRELPDYRLADRLHLMLRVPTVFQRNDGTFFTIDGYDLQVFTPRPQYRNGRPDWLAKMRREVRIDTQRLGLRVHRGFFAGEKPLVIEAQLRNESDESIPLDQIIVRPNDPLPTLMLHAGEYFIRAKNESGKITAEYKLTVS